MGNIPGKGEIICKGPVAEEIMDYSKDTKEASVAGGSGVC